MTATTLKRFAAADRICPVLDLNLAQLNLNLLGLIVHLDRVHPTITANSRGGLWAACSARWRTRRYRLEPRPSV